MLRLAHSEFLYALAAVPLFILLFFVMIRWKKKVLKRFGDHALVQKLLPDVSPARLRFKLSLILLAFVFLVIGIADPQIGNKLEEVKREGVDIIIALDVSNSMKAEDIKPNRLERAKQAVSRMIDKLQNDRIGIIVFAGQAYTQLPLTTDYGAAKLFLSSVDCDMIPSQGTAIGAAIDLAYDSFTALPEESEQQQKKLKHQALVIITDGENHEDDAAGSAKKAAEAGIVIHTIGMGSPEGAPLPLYRNGQISGYRKDASGNTVVSKLDESILQQIAAGAGGQFIRASSSNDGLDAILKEISTMEKKNFGMKIYTDYEDRFQYFIGIALLILLIDLLISERRSKTLAKINLFGEKKT